MAVGGRDPVGGVLIWEAAKELDYEGVLVRDGIEGELAIWDTISSMSVSSSSSICVVPLLSMDMPLCTTVQHGPTM